MGRPPIFFQYSYLCRNNRFPNVASRLILLHIFWTSQNLNSQIAVCISRDSNPKKLSIHFQFESIYPLYSRTLGRRSIHLLHSIRYQYLENSDNEVPLPQEWSDIFFFIRQGYSKCRRCSFKVRHPISYQRNDSSVTDPLLTVFESYDWGKGSVGTLPESEMIRVFFWRR